MFTPCTCSPLTLTAHSESESVCKMSSMVFNTRPLHSRWGNLAEMNQQGGGGELGCNEPSVTAGRSTALMVDTNVSAKPERYLSATRRILLCVWLKLTSKNWACRSSSSSCSLVFGWKRKSQSKIAALKRHSGQTSKFSSGRLSCEAAHLFCHHLQKDFKHLVAHTDNALHHACRGHKGVNEENDSGPMCEMTLGDRAGIRVAPDLSFWMALSSKYRNMTWNLSGSLERSILGESQQQNFHLRHVS